MKTLNTAEKASSRYTGVSYLSARTGTEAERRWKDRLPWRADIGYGDRRRSKNFSTEREAALQYDKWVLELDLDRPLNILKPAA